MSVPTRTINKISLNKLVLSRNDDKCITVNGISSLVRGHWATRKNIIYIHKMEPLTIETFNPDMIKVTNSEQKRAGEINCTSVKFEYNGGKIPPLRINGKFRLFTFNPITYGILTFRQLQGGGAFWPGSGKQGYS